MQRLARNSQGFTLVQVLVGVAVASTVLMAIMQFNTINQKLIKKSKGHSDYDNLAALIGHSLNRDDACSRMLGGQTFIPGQTTSMSTLELDGHVLAQSRIMTKYTAGLNITGLQIESLSAPPGEVLVNPQGLAPGTYRRHLAQFTLTGQLRQWSESTIKTSKFASKTTTMLGGPLVTHIPLVLITNGSSQIVACSGGQKIDEQQMCDMIGGAYTKGAAIPCDTQTVRDCQLLEQSKSFPAPIQTGNVYTFEVKCPDAKHIPFAGGGSCDMGVGTNPPASRRPFMTANSSNLTKNQWETTCRVAESETLWALRISIKVLCCEI